MNKLILTYASGEMVSSKSFLVFLNSTKIAKDADLVILTHDMDSSIRKKIQEIRPTKIIDVEAGENYYLYRDRHLHFYKYLCNNQYEHVLITDSRDVLFQNNPFNWIRNQKLKKDFLVITEEGFEKSKNGFACIEHFEFQRDVPMLHLKDEERYVYNAGIALGSANSIKHYELLLFMTTLKSTGRCTDQASLNYLIDYLLLNDCVSSSPIKDNLCLTGEGVKFGVEIKIENDVIFNSENNPYFIVHQWDRIKDFEDIATKKYIG